MKWIFSTIALIRRYNAGATIQEIKSGDQDQIRTTVHHRIFKSSAYFQISWVTNQSIGLWLRLFSNVQRRAPAAPSRAKSENPSPRDCILLCFSWNGAIPVGVNRFDDFKGRAISCGEIEKSNSDLLRGLTGWLATSIADWYTENGILANSKYRVTGVFSVRYIIVMRSLLEADFWQYWCLIRHLFWSQVCISSPVAPSRFWIWWHRLPQDTILELNVTS